MSQKPRYEFDGWVDLEREDVRDVHGIRITDDHVRRAIRAMHLITGQRCSCDGLPPLPTQPPPRRAASMLGRPRPARI